VTTLSNPSCKECGNDDKPIVARGMCKKCYDIWYKCNKGTTVINKRRPRKAKPTDTRVFPIPHQVTIWECSDGYEFSSEVDALRYEIELFKCDKRGNSVK